MKAETVELEKKVAKDIEELAQQAGVLLGLAKDVASERVRATISITKNGSIPSFEAKVKDGKLFVKAEISEKDAAHLLKTADEKYKSFKKKVVIAKLKEVVGIGA